jgi:hypothetical protein
MKISINEMVYKLVENSDILPNDVDDENLPKETLACIDFIAILFNKSSTEITDMFHAEYWKQRKENNSRDKESNEMFARMYEDN